MHKVRMRDDLAQKEMGIPAFTEINASPTYLFEDDLLGAELICDNDDDTKPEYNYEHIALKDGRVFYVIGADLDYEEAT